MKKYKKELIVLAIYIIFHVIVFWYASTLTGHGDGMALGIFLGVFDVVILIFAFIWAIYKIIKKGYIKTAIGIAIGILGLAIFYIKQNFNENDAGLLDLFFNTFYVLALIIGIVWGFYKIIKNGYIKTVIGLAIILIIYLCSYFYFIQNAFNQTQEGVLDVKVILKQANLSLEDYFVIKGLTKDEGKNCGFNVEISEKSHQQLIEQIKQIPEVQEDSERYILEKPNGYTIIVDKYAKWLSIFGCPEVLNVEYGNYDDWLKNVRIDNIHFLTPKLNKEQLNSEEYYGAVEDSTNAIKKPWDFILINGSQPGIYSYDIGIGKIEKGNIYLKAFETTTNHPLSADGLKAESTIHVENKQTKLKIESNLFTIYEGDWGNEYLARFELWYKADQSQQERKLSKKVYKIEGWER